MNIQDLVPDLDICQKAKEKGVVIESSFWWIKGKMEYGYEGEWEILEGDEYFLFDLTIGKKTFEDYEITPAMSIESGNTEEEYRAWDEERAIGVKRMRETIFPAPLTDEILEAIEMEDVDEITIRKGEVGIYKKGVWKWVEDKKLSNALLLLAIKLKEEGIIK